MNYGRRLENSEEGVLTAPRYRVTLTAEERWELEGLPRAATKTTGKRFLYVWALSLCDRAPGGRGAGCLGPNGRAPETAVYGAAVEFALERKRPVRSPREVIFDGVFKARLVALACSQTPPGRKRWRLRLPEE